MFFFQSNTLPIDGIARYSATIPLAIESETDDDQLRPLGILALQVHPSGTEDTMDKLLLTIPEAAQRLSIGRSSLYALVSAEAIPVVKIGRSVRISVRAVEEFAAKLEGRAQ